MLTFGSDIVVFVTWKVTLTKLLLGIKYSKQNFGYYKWKNIVINLDNIKVFINFDTIPDTALNFLFPNNDWISLPFSNIFWGFYTKNGVL